MLKPLNKLTQEQKQPLATVKFDKDTGKPVEVKAHDKLHALDSIAEITGVKKGAAAQVRVGWRLEDIRELCFPLRARRWAV